jgi:5-(carboxyamino)imidazole ribonucleotide mutase
MNLSGSRGVRGVNAIILMGSKADLKHCQKIAGKLQEFGINAIFRVASAHKTPEKVLEILKEYENEEVVFITVAGRSNALSGFVDANTSKPVIACPPYSEAFAGMDILSSIRMPSGVAPMLVMDAENAALAAAKIFALKHEEMAERVREYQERKREELYAADEEVRKIPG